MKKSGLSMKLAAITLVMTMITASLVSGTYSKYTQQVTATDTVRVAKFAFNLKDTGGAHVLTQSSSSGAIDIFKHTDAGVYGSGSTKIIAPGTTGTLNFTVENLSEVKVGATFVLTETNDSNIPIYYTLGSNPQRYSAKLTGTYSGGTYASLSALQSAMAIASINASDGTTPVTNTVDLKWTWAFDSAGTGQTDSADTALGIGGTATVTLAIQTTVTQLDA